MSEWKRYRRSVVFYNKEEFIPRRDVRNTIADLIDIGDELKEKADLLGDISSYPENKFGPMTVLDYLDLVELQAETYTRRALVAEEKLRRISEFTTKDEDENG